MPQIQRFFVSGPVSFNSSSVVVDIIGKEEEIMERYFYQRNLRVAF